MAPHKRLRTHDTAVDWDMPDDPVEDYRHCMPVDLFEMNFEFSVDASYIVPDVNYDRPGQEAIRRLPCVFFTVVVVAPATSESPELIIPELVRAADIIRHDFAIF